LKLVYYNKDKSEFHKKNGEFQGNEITKEKVFGRVDNDLASLEFTDIKRKSFQKGSILDPNIFGNFMMTSNYSCKCGMTTGWVNEGLSCNHCNTTVLPVGTNLEQWGFIDLDPFHIISYPKYFILEKIIGINVLKSIIRKSDLINLDGQAVEQDDDGTFKRLNDAYLQTKLKNHNYKNLGLKNFYIYYEDIINFYARKYISKQFNVELPDEWCLYDFLSDPKNEGKDMNMFKSVATKEDVFIDKIIVAPISLRPIHRTKDGIQQDEMGNLYTKIVAEKVILDGHDHVLDSYIEEALLTIQLKYFELANYIVKDKLAGKEGYIRDKINGTKLNYTARLILSPSDVSKYNVGDCILPYFVAVNFLKYEIISILSSIKNINYQKALDYYTLHQYDFNQEIYLIMKKIISDNEVGVLLNRAPTLNYGSVVYLKFADIKDIYEDQTLAVHPLTFSLYNGDVDGDVVTIVLLHDKELIEKMKNSLGVEQMLTDPNNGKLSKKLNISKDILYGLWKLIG
jgi:DNA-directed RNA polymerase beta' subunit